jgi:hypothetical protein
LDQIVVGWSTTDVFAVHNLRLREGQWLIDVTHFAMDKTETKVVGAKISWEKISQLIPEAIFKKPTQQHLENSRIVSFVKLNIKTLKVDQSKGGRVSEVNPSSAAENGVILVNIETGNEIAIDVRRGRVRNF